GLVRRFHLFTNGSSWSWAPQDPEAFTAHLRGGGSAVALSTVRSYQCAIRLFPRGPRLKSSCSGVRLPWRRLRQKGKATKPLFLANRTQPSGFATRGTIPERGGGSHCHGR
ncbi:MAG: hypothetical protein LC808_37670, partial [Actinobacteria bacterium]|nr:hypothetical protein [Actinomycetota bacterium]